MLTLKRGDHICAIYSSRAELAQVVSGFLADGLRGHERCWYVASGDETDIIRTALQSRRIDVKAETACGALKLISDDGAYVVHGRFDPETTLRVFNDAIEQAYTDGFTGFRAAAEMSWALGCENGPEQLVVYEALLRSLFASCRAIGLCLYDRQQMPLAVINGALATHPVVASSEEFRANPFYDSKIDRLPQADDADVIAKLHTLGRSTRLSNGQS